MTRQNEEETNTLWEFIQESAGDGARVIGGIAAGTIIGGVWGYSQLVDMMRTIFGQSAPAITCIGSTMFAVTLGGVTYYFARKRRGAHPGQAEGRPVAPVNGGPAPAVSHPAPGSNVMDRVINMMMAPPTAEADRPGSEQTADSNGRIVREVNNLDESWLMMKRISEELHILSLGGTGAGKTVFFTAVSQLAIQDGGKIYVLDGKPGMGWEEKWPGATRKFKDPAAFIPVLKTAVVAMEKRIAAGKHQFPGMYIIIDEAQRVTGQYDDAVDLVADLSSRGREYNVHVWLLSQAATADLIGFGGKMAVLEKNFTAVELLREEDKYQFSFARFQGGGIRSVGERYLTPYLPSPWDDTGNAPVWDDGGEFAQIGVVHPVSSNGYKPVQMPRRGVERGALVENAPPLSPAPVLVVQDETEGEEDADEKAARYAQWLLDNMTDESTYPNGSGYLTVGEMLAIVYLNDQAEWSQNRIISFVLGVKNPQRLTAVGNVLKAHGEKE